MKYPDDILNQIVIGDCVEVMRDIPDNTVHMCVTSPPYWGKRDYQSDGDSIPGQLGLEDTPEEYIRQMERVFREVHRVLRPDGTLWLNTADTYSNQKGKSGAVDPARQAHRYAAKQSLNVAATTLGTKGMTTPANRAHPTLQQKDMIGVPWRTAFALQGHAVIGCPTIHEWAEWLAEARSLQDWEMVEWVEKRIRLWDYTESLKACGWRLRQDIIWNKPNPRPESMADRCTTSFEYLFLLTKSKHYFCDMEAIKELAVNEKMPGHNMTDTRETYGDMSGGNSGLRDLWRKYNDEGLPTYRNKHSVWTIVPEPYGGAHFAVFPSKLVEPCILAGTSEKGCCPDCGTPWYRMTQEVDTGETQKMPDAFATYPGDHGSIHRNGREKGESGKPVMTNETIGWRPGCFCGDWICESEAPEPVPCIVMDPFGGTGTTAKRAEELRRSFIHIDLAFGDLARQRIAQRMLI